MITTTKIIVSRADVASYVLGKIAKLPDGTTVGTDIVERVGIASKHRELNVYRVILRR